MRRQLRKTRLKGGIFDEARQCEGVLSDRVTKQLSWFKEIRKSYKTGDGGSK